jgi:hypothetical protein
LAICKKESVELAFQIMKPRHAAALALVAWYLMIPPPRQIDSRFQTNFLAPIDKWVQLRRFELESECEAARDDYMKNPPGGVANMLSSKQQAQAVMKAAKCVSADDPRLIEH